MQNLPSFFLFPFLGYLGFIHPATDRTTGKTKAPSEVAFIRMIKKKETDKYNYKSTMQFANKI